MGPKVRGSTKPSLVYDPNDHRQHMLYTRVREDEYQLLKVFAESQHQTVSATLRGILRGGSNPIAAAWTGHVRKWTGLRYKRIPS